MPEPFTTLLPTNEPEAETASSITPCINIEHPTSVEVTAQKQEISNTDESISFVDHEPTPEGGTRTRNKELAAICKYAFYIGQWYAAHVARGKWQEARIQGSTKTCCLTPINKGMSQYSPLTSKGRRYQTKICVSKAFAWGLKYFVKDGIMQQHYVDLIFDQSSNQSLEKTMTGLSAQLDFIRQLYPDLQTIWIVSDKCSNFNSFEQISFVIAGNVRNWELPETQLSPDATPDQKSALKKKQEWMRNLIPIYTATKANNRQNRTRWTLKVAKWMFTEAQLGKDQLDCHFAYISESFKAFLQVEGNNLTHARDMYAALKDGAFDISNTHVLWGSTLYPSLGTKFTMQWMKVHQVHEYSYTCLPNGVHQEVELAYHGSINTHTIKTHETFKTSDNKYKKWIVDCNFDPVQWEMQGVHVCRPEKLTFKTAKPDSLTVTKSAKTFLRVSAYQCVSESLCT
jgi:hypothetical protein